MIAPEEAAFLTETADKWPRYRTKADVAREKCEKILDYIHTYPSVDLPTSMFIDMIKDIIEDLGQLRREIPAPSGYDVTTSLEKLRGAVIQNRATGQKLKLQVESLKRSFDEHHTLTCSTIETIQKAVNSVLEALHGPGERKLRSAPLL